MRAAEGHFSLAVLLVFAAASVGPAQDTLWLHRFDFGADAQAVGIDYRDGAIAVAGAVTNDSTYSSGTLCSAAAGSLADTSQPGLPALGKLRGKAQVVVAAVVALVDSVGKTQARVGNLPDRK